MQNFDSLFVDCTKNAKKLKTKDYNTFGKYIIVDQGQNEIAGYTDFENGVYENVPVLIFGDHTRCIKYVNKPFYIGADGVKVLKLKNENNNYKYFYYALKNIDIPNTGYNRHFKWLKEAKFKEHDLLQQKEIVEILDNITNIIDFKHKQLELLDDLIKSRFIEMFGDPNVNNKGFLTGIINDIGTCVAGATPSTKVETYWKNGTIPWMSSGEVNKYRVFETDTKITRLGYDASSTKLVPPKTVVLAMAGQGKTRGTAAITEIELCTNQSLCSIVNNEKVNAEFLLYFLKMQYSELRSASTNTDGRGGLNLKIIGNFPIIIPNIELQNQFASFVEQVDKSKFVHAKKTHKTNTFHASKQY